MQLVNMDVNRSDSSQRCHLGDFSSGLNAICGPKGSGKTTLLSWLRDITAPGGWNRATHTPVTGSVVLQQNELLHPDYRGQRGTIATDHRGIVRYDVHNHRELGASNSNVKSFPVLTGEQQHVFHALAAATGSSDTEAELMKLAQSLNLNAENTLQDETRARLVERERQLAAELEHRSKMRGSREDLLVRRENLDRELAAVRREISRFQYSGHTVDHRRIVDRYASLDVDLKNILLEIEHLDREIADVKSELKVHEVDQASVNVDISYRKQLKQLEERLERWRQTLRDLRAHRESIEHDLTDRRLEQQVGDQLSATKHADPRAALRSLEAQILTTKQQLDAMVEQHAASEAAAREKQEYRVRHDRYGRTHIAYTDTYSPAPGQAILPETLQAMQNDLYEVCQQLARYQATSAAENHREQSQQLQRCETELLKSVEKLIEERAQLLRKIADEHHLSLEQLNIAFGRWYQCHDHQQLQEWLLKDDGERQSVESTTSYHLIETLESLQAKRKQANLRAEECKRQLRDADLVRRDIRSTIAEPAGRAESEILRDLDEVATQLRTFDDYERLRVELDDVRRQLATTPVQRVVEDRFQVSVDRHIAGLMGADERRYGQHVYESTQVSLPTYRFETRAEVPSSIRRVAMRLAIADAMAARRAPVALLLDQPLDDIGSDLQRRAVAYLNGIAAKGQQVILLSSDENVVNLVRSFNGFVDYMQAVESEDINRHLAAVANVTEEEKWSRPATTNEHSDRGPYYLYDRSEIGELPSIPDDVVDECCSLGVDIIGDLIDVDPAWLADSLKIKGVTTRTVERWQAEANLLSSVKNLRPFDARVLVGAGVRTPGELSQMHPSELFERVEYFLTTERGRSILRSGNSYELSRITSWISAAKNGTSLHQYSSQRDRRTSRSRSSRRSASRSGWNSQRDYDRGSYDNEREGYAKRSSSSSRRSSSSRTERRSYPVVRSERSERSEASERSRSSRSRSSSGRSSSSARTVRIAKSEESTLKFYLELSSPVVDAPSIGPRMAGRLEKFNILTVDQLLAANAEALADKLDLRRVNAETIVAWQEQARLVCRIPNLRGHDAQLLVACEIISPEELSTMDPQAVLTQVLAVANSSEGSRILRGGKEPDLEEVTDWISWASSCRSLNAA